MLSRSSLIMSNNHLDLSHIYFGYGSTLLFEDFSWGVADGARWAVVGKSGCGKSTLLALASGLIKPGQGQIIFAGDPIDKPHPDIGLVIQDYGLLPWYTVENNLLLGHRLQSGQRISRKDQYALVSSLLHKLDLPLSLISKYPDKLSGGQRQRVAIGRTLATNPKVLLLDEPFASVDALTREVLQQTVLQLVEQAGLSLVLVTHDVREAVFMADQVLLLRGVSNKDHSVIETPGAGTNPYSAAAQAAQAEIAQALEAPR